jgi:hypothetical protein
LENSFYCGDAYGEGSWSASDIEFAQNAGLKFYKPEVVFSVSIDTIDKLLPDGKYVLIMCGMPGAGKSTTVVELHKFVKNLVVLSQEKANGKYSKHSVVLKSAEEHVKAGHSIVIDATNPLDKNLGPGDLANRKDYIDLAKRYDFTPIIIYVKRDGKKNNSERKFDKDYVYQERDLAMGVNINKDPIPSQAISMFLSKLVVPSREEAEIIVIN